MGAAPSSTFDPVRDLPDMKGKVIIVTGSSSGIGLASLQHLSRMGAKVYMATPDEEQTKAALKRVEDEGREPGLGQVLWHELDLKDPRTAKASAERFLEKETKLDVLINNAAMISDLGNPQLNSDGIQDNMAINYLGPFIFTQTLLPLLEKSSSSGKNDVRIVNVGSGGHEDVTYFSFDSKEAWNHKFRFTLLPPLARYKYSKMAVHLWSNHLAQRLTSTNSNIMSLIVHPGAIMSDGAIRCLKTLPLSSLWISLLRTIMHPQSRGALTSVFAASAPPNNDNTTNPNIYHGAYIVPPNIAGTQSRVALDKSKQDELFTFTVTLLNEIGVHVEGIN